MADGRVEIDIDADASSYEQKLAGIKQSTAARTGEMSKAVDTQSAKMLQSLSNIGGAVESVGTTMSVAITAPVVAAAGASYKLASDFESSMSRVAGALDVPVSSISDLRDLAIQTGQDTIFSASEAGAAMEELAKGGLTSADIKGGALKTTMDLAAAGGLQLADAANTVVQSMGAFGLSADQTGEAANALAGAAAASSADVADLTQGLSQASAQAHSAGWSIQDTTAVLGGFADAGIKGSDAGTSLKTMLQSLAAPTDKAADLINELGINVRDQNGNMKDAAGVAEELNSKLGGLSSAQKDAAMQTIFGSDASRAALVMTNLGREGVEKYTAATNDQAAAQRLADSQMGESERAIENMKGAVETAAITLGTELAPIVTDVANGVSDAAEAFGEMDESQQKMLITAVAVVAGIGPVLTVVGKLMGSVQTLNELHAAATSIISNLRQESESAAKSTIGLGTATEKAGAGATTASIGMNAFNAACKATAVGLVLALVADLVGQLNAYSDRQQLATDATQGMSDAMDSAASAYQRQKDSLDAQGQALENSTISAEKCLQSQADLATKINETWTGYGTNAALVDNYAASIQELGNKGSLSADEQEKLRIAVDEFNGITGSSISIINAQTGELSANRDAIFAVAEAYKEEARSAAARELYSDVTKQLIQDELSLEDAQNKLNSASEGFGIWVGDFPVVADEASVAYHDLQSNVSDLEGATQSAKDTQSRLLEMISSSGGSFATLEDALASAGSSMSAFGDISDSQLAALQENFDGSLASIVSTCASQGIAIPETLASAMLENGGSVEDAAATISGSANGKLLELSEGSYVPGSKLSGNFAMGVESGSGDAQAKGEAVAGSATSGLDSGDGATPGSTLGSVFADGVGNQAGNANAQGVGTAGSATAGLWTGDGSSPGSTLGSLFANGVGGQSGNARSQGSSVADAAGGGMQSNGGSSWSWGAHLVQNFANGISAMASWATSAATGIANAVASILGHTVAKKGPLHVNGRGERAWGEHLVDNIITGMQSKHQALSSEAETIASLLDLGDEAAESAPGFAAKLSLAAPSGSAYSVTNYYYTIDGVDISGDPAAQKAAETLWSSVRRQVRMR